MELKSFYLRISPENEITRIMHHSLLHEIGNGLSQIEHFIPKKTQLGVSSIFRRWSQTFKNDNRLRKCYMIFIKSNLCNECGKMILVKAFIDLNNCVSRRFDPVGNFLQNFFVLRTKCSLYHMESKTAKKNWGVRA